MSIINEIKSSLNIKDKITDDDLYKIRSADWDTLVKWWDMLNSWEWPTELLPEEAPLISGDDLNQNDRRIILMELIKKKVGEKYILRILNTRGMTEEEFEDFWLAHHEHDSKAFKRDQKRVNKLCNQIRYEKD
jgi:hypothetical protein